MLYIKLKRITTAATQLQICCRYTPPPPPPATLWMGFIAQNSFFTEHGHVVYQIKWNHEISQHGSIYLLADLHPPPPPKRTLGIGSIGQNSTISEHAHVAYQIQENYDCSNALPNISPAYPHDPGDGVNRSKFNFFRTWSYSILHK